MKTPQRKNKKKVLKKSSLKPLIKKILVPIDFTPSSQKAIDYSISLAKVFNSKIELIHVVEPMSYASDVVFNQATYPLVDIEYKKFDDEKLRKLVSELKTKYDKISFHSSIGLPYSEVVDYSKTQKVDLIVLGTHPKNSIEKLFFGSTTEKILRNSSCPILILNLEE